MDVAALAIEIIHSARKVGVISKRQDTINVRATRIANELLEEETNEVSRLRTDF